VQCCVENWGSCCASGASGICKTTSTCGAEGGTSTPGLCRGATNVQCCTQRGNSDHTCGHKETPPYPVLGVPFADMTAQAWPLAESSIICYDIDNSGPGSNGVQVPTSPVATDFTCRTRKFMARRGGGRRWHSGTDLYAPVGTDVLAAESGVIVNAYPFFENVCCVIQQTDSGVVINYGEIDCNYVVRIGDRVGVGQKIGEVGHLQCCQPMLHFETYTRGTTANQRSSPGAVSPRLLNPAEYLLHAGGLFGSTQSSSWSQSCRAPEGEGTCVDTSNELCGGTLHTGHCSGPSNIRCCVEGSSTPNTCTASGVAGSCVDRDVCIGSGRVATVGRCVHDPVAVQCCTEVKCSHEGQSGFCKDTSQCGGETHIGLCPGPANVRCCTPTTTTSLEGVDAQANTEGQTPTNPITDRTMGLITVYEGLHAEFYMDPVGIPTVGYGHACHVNDCTRLRLQRLDGSTYVLRATKIRRDPQYRLDAGPLTATQARDLLRADLANNFQPCVNRALARSNAPRLTDDQYGACISLAFNIGCGGFARSTVLERVAAGAPLEGPAGVRDAFVMWRRAGGECMNGLVRRRHGEADLYGSRCTGRNCAGCGTCADLECRGRRAATDEVAELPTVTAMCDVPGEGAGACLPAEDCIGTVFFQSDDDTCPLCCVVEEEYTAEEKALMLRLIPEAMSCLDEIELMSDLSRVLAVPRAAMTLRDRSSGTIVVVNIKDSYTEKVTADAAGTDLGRLGIDRLVLAGDDAIREYDASVRVRDTTSAGSQALSGLWWLSAVVACVATAWAA